MNYWVSGILLLIIGCDQKVENYYFDFDAIEHYTIEINENKLLQNLENPNLTENQKLQVDIILEDKPVNLTDTLFVEDLEIIGFIKTQIPVTNHQEIKEIFREKSHRNVVTAACIAVYRDVIIFRKNGEIKGIVKICFDCGKNQILGTDANTIEFGQSGDYSKLAEILKR